MQQPLNLNPDAIRQANNASHFDAGDALAREAQRVFENGLQAFAPQAGWTAEQTAYAQSRAEAWRALVEEAYNDQLRRRASWVPVSVAGPSNYDGRKNGKRADAAMKAGAAWAEKLDRFRANTAKRLHALIPADTMIQRYRDGRCSDPISADDPAALEKLTARIQRLQDVQAHMKALNAHYRKHKTHQGFPGIPDDQAAALDEAIANACAWDKRPYPAFELTNNNANIKRLEERLQQLVKARAKAETQEQDAEKTFAGLRVVEDAADNRIRLYFDDKPDEATRALLKSRGFRWSPNAKAWQRQLNGNGRYAARLMVKALELTQQEQAAPEAAEPETITFDEFVRRVQA